MKNNIFDRMVKYYYVLYWLCHIQLICKLAKTLSLKQKFLDSNNASCIHRTYVVQEKSFLTVCYKKKDIQKS